MLTTRANTHRTRSKRSPPKSPPKPTSRTHKRTTSAADTEKGPGVKKTKQDEQEDSGPPAQKGKGGKQYVPSSYNCFTDNNYYRSSTQHLKLGTTSGTGNNPPR